MKNELKIKVCGLKYYDNIGEVIKLVPQYIGFIFYPKSKRYVGENFSMPEVPSHIKKVGVFVNEKFENINSIVKKHKIDMLQLHGEESADFCRRVRAVLPVIKTFGIDDNFDFNDLTKYTDCCDYFLFDTKTKEYGGSGKKFDWNLLNRYKIDKPYFISGGLDVEAVSTIAKLTIDTNNELTNNGNVESKLFALDLNSCFETEPGKKDIGKLKAALNELSGKR